MKRLLFGLTVVIIVAGCGIPLQDAPEAIDVAVRPVVPPAVDDTASPSGGTIYLVGERGLVAVDRERSTDVEALLALLFLGPTPAEEQIGLRSAIPPSAMVRDVVVDGRSAVVDVSQPFAAVGGEEEILAVAQIVLTLTTDLADLVTIELEGTPVAIPLPDGVLATLPVGFGDYVDLIER
jgi:hypothetical protein